MSEQASTASRYSIVAVCLDRFNFCWMDTMEQINEAVETWKAYENTRYIFVYDGPKLVRTHSGRARVN